MTKLIGSYSFEHICTIRPTIDADGAIRSFLPQSLYVKRTDLSLHDFGAGPFCKFSIPRTLRTAGVYALTIGDEIRYIGECENLSSRYNAGYGQISPRNCFTGGQPTNCRINNLIYQETLAGKQVDLWFFETADFKDVEAGLLAQLRPIWNRKGVAN